ncbi:MAG: putative metal-dependent hydrolase [Gemmatimonadetes bacterium]|nr:putative metal-dependent hydrolase [Gemmatimonadota bacterium]
MTIDLAYPLGRFERPTNATAAERTERIARIRDLASELRGAVHGLTDPQLDTPYRPGGWTVRQVVHHLADSHTNALTRLKIALTEENPTIRPYQEKGFAELVDARLPIEPSLQMLDGAHARLVTLFEAMTPDDFARPYVHPVTGPQILDVLLAMYAWHGRHHTAHITGLRAREHW